MPKIINKNQEYPQETFQTNRHSKINVFEQKCKEIRHLFWEFYILEYLDYKLSNHPLISGRLSDKLKNYYNNITDKFFEKSKNALEQSIRSEMKYIFRAGPSLMFDAIDVENFEREWDDYGTAMGCDNIIGNRALRDLNKYLRSFKQYNINRKISSKTAPIEWGKIAFQWPGWSSSYCGEKWALACETYLESTKVKTQKDKILWVDRCLDLYHNNGFLLNKTEFIVLEQVGDLNERYCLQSWVPAAKDYSNIKEFVEDEDRTMACTISQKMFPFSTFTRGTTISYERFL